MFRDMLSGSRAIQAGLVFFVLVVAGSSLYSWHVHRTTDAELAQSNALLQQHANKNEPHTATDTVDTSTVDFEQTEMPLETDDLQMSDDTDMSPIDETSEVLDLADAFLPDNFVSEEAPAEDIPVSPFGFGPYPEVPADYPLSIPWHWSEEFIANLEKTIEKSLQVRGVSFTEHLKTNELMARVGIKLWNEGQYFDGMTSSDQTGLIYPNDPDVLYVEWSEAKLPNGEVKRYMSQTIGSALSGLSIAEQEGREPLPDRIEIRSLEEGIDPYDFLEFDR